MLTLAGHSGTVRCLNLNGNRLVSGSVDRSIKVCLTSVIPGHPFDLRSDQHLISHYNITPESHIKVRNKGNDHQPKRLLIVKQLLLVSTSGCYGEYAY